MAQAHPLGAPGCVPTRDAAASKLGGSRELTKEAEGLALIFISCLLRYSGNLIFSWFSKPQQSPSIPPRAGSMNIRTCECTVTSRSPAISAAPLDDGHRVPPRPRRASGTTISPRSWEQTASSSLAAQMTSKHRSYSDFLKPLKSPCAQTRDAHGAPQTRRCRKISPFQRVSRNDRTLELLSEGKITLETNPSHCKQ